MPCWNALKQSNQKLRIMLCVSLIHWSLSSLKLCSFILQLVWERELCSAVWQTVQHVDFSTLVHTEHECGRSSGYQKNLALIVAATTFVWDALLANFIGSYSTVELILPMVLISHFQKTSVIYFLRLVQHHALHAVTKITSWRYTRFCESEPPIEFETKDDCYHVHLD